MWFKILRTSIPHTKQEKDSVVVSGIVYLQELFTQTIRFV